MKRLRNALLAIILTTVITKAGLRFIDPVGWYKTLQDWQTLAQVTVAHDGTT